MNVFFDGTPLSLELFISIKILVTIFSFEYRDTSWHYLSIHEIIAFLTVDETSSRIENDFRLLKTN